MECSNPPPAWPLSRLRSAHGEARRTRAGAPADGPPGHRRLTMFERLRLAMRSRDTESRAAVVERAAVLIVPGRGAVLDAAVDVAAAGRQDLAVRRGDEQVAARVLVDHRGAAGELAHPL